MNALVSPQADKPRHKKVALINFPRTSQALITAEQVKQTREVQWQTFALKVSTFCQSKRGGYSRLAEQMGVSRQTVWRWFGPGSYRTMPPAWAGVVANVWYYDQQRQLTEARERMRSLSPDRETKLLR